MNDLALDENGDLKLVGGDLILTTGIDAIIQHLLQRLRFFLGEWFLDNRYGVPYYQHIFKKNYDPNIIDSIFKRTILMTPGVTELLSFDVDIDSKARHLSLSFTAKTKSGIVEINGFEV